MLVVPSVLPLMSAQRQRVVLVAADGVGAADAQPFGRDQIRGPVRQRPRGGPPRPNVTFFHGTK